MKALYFTKIDYIRARVQLAVTFAALLAVMLILKLKTDGTDLLIFLYGIFFVIVFSTVPFGNCSRADAGFLQLLPATTGQRVLGRYLFGLTLLGIGFLLSMGGTVMGHLITGSEIDEMLLPLYMIIFAAGLLIITIQYIILYLTGENLGSQFLSLVRMIPGMSFYFGSLELMAVMRKEPDRVMRLLELIGERLDMIGWCSIAFSLAVMAAGVILCTKVTEKKDH